ncbi:site-specific integrase [Brevibacillus brevis]|uniref:site-specific integrase n=1 Tax=Brevibacillus brevis TaxID=1393 RepID=UPI0007D8999C|nr:site-specific integrase [Brevibacillus brevis]
MSNAYLNETELYNKKLKEEFVSRYPESAHNVYRRIFYYSAAAERMYGIDLYEFNLNQISEVLFSINASSLASVKSAVSIVRAYIDWAIHRRSNNINPLDIIDGDWEKQFVDSTKKLFFSKNEIDEIISKSKNAQDAVIIALLFEGAGGKEVSELRNLRPEDVDYEDKSITLTNENGEQRLIKVEDQTLHLIKEAIRQGDYYKRNGHVSPNARNTKETSELIETGYVIKPAKTKVVHVEQVNTHLIYARLSGISDEDMLDIPNFTVKNIQRSGMVYMAKQILDRDGKFEDREQYFEICKKFGVNTIDNNGYETYNWFPIKQFVNIDMINQLYGDDSLS